MTKKNLEKMCRTCKVIKPLIDFYADSSYSSGIGARCKPCESERHRLYMATENGKKIKKIISQRYEKNNVATCNLRKQKYKKEHDRHLRSLDLMSKYGITLEQYELMFHEQNGLCAICGTANKSNRVEYYLFVDHCHKTGLVRGLLCQKCNLGIGQLGDSIPVIERALLYLKRFNTPNL